MKDTEKKKKVSDFESFASNPYQKSLKPALKFGWRRVDPEKAKPMVDHDSGEVVFLSDVGNVKLMLKDITEFTKLYGGALTEIQKLTTPGVLLLTYVFTLIKKDIDEIRIEPCLAMEWCHYASRTQFYRGLCSLLENNFICRKTGGSMEYYINVNYFFNGKRTNLEYGISMKDRLVAKHKDGHIDLEELNETPEE